MSKNKKKQQNQAILTTLRHLDISLDASRLYEYLLEGGSNNFSHIAKQLNISRPYLYKLIAELVSHDLVSFNKESGSNRLQLLPPTNILQKLRDQKKKIELTEKTFIDTLPGLMSQYEQGSQPAKVRVITGEQDFIDLLFSMAEEESKLAEYFGSIEDFIELISWDTQNKWLKKRVEKGIKMHALLLPSEDTRILQRSDKEQLRESRIHLTDNLFKTSFHLFSNKVIFWQPIGKLAVVIEDQYIYSMMKSVFSSLWDRAGERYKTTLTE